MAVAARLSHTVALVTGGSSGLGAGAASCLVRHGARVLVADLAAQETAFLQWATALGVPIVGGATTSATNGQPVAHIAAYDNKGGPAVSFVTTDVTDVTQVTRALDAVERRFGEPLNALVNCAGIAVARKTLSKKGNPHPLEEFSRVLSVNAIGSFNTACLSAERMSRREMNDEDGLRGCIIHTASIAAYEGQVGQAAYAASKGAVVGMTLPMARDLAPWGIRVMTIAPGLFATPLLDGLPEDVRRELGATVPCPSRLGRPEEFGNAVVAILENAMLNGSVIRLDGALRMPP